MSKNFEIFNLNEALKLINDNKAFSYCDSKSVASSSESLNSQNDMSKQFLDLIITSPVFYNTRLIPSCKYKFQSQFTRTVFSDVELKQVLL